MIINPCAQFSLFCVLLVITDSTFGVHAAPTIDGQLLSEYSLLLGSNAESFVQDTQNAALANPALHQSLIRRHDQPLQLANHLSPSGAHGKRSMTVDLVAAGSRILFDQFDIVIATALEHLRMQEAYKATVKEMKRRYGSIGEIVGDRVYIIAMSYGALKFSAVSAAENSGITSEMVATALIVFLEMMVELTHFVLMMPFMSWLWVENAGRAVWVFMEMAMMQDGPVQDADPFAYVG
ncbi:MAG: hypothetical protein Q9168_002867 [Polycauliona sp. 1 TL-2023]